MKAKDLKKFLDNLSKDDLNKEVILVSDVFSTSIPIKKIKKNPYNLLWNGDEDPSQLKTRNAFIQDGYDPEDVDSLEVEIKKGDIVIEA